MIKKIMAIATLVAISVMGGIYPSAAQVDTTARGLAIQTKASLEQQKLFTQLKTAANAAQISNPTDAKPWTTLPSWQATSAYVKNDVVLSTGGQYVQVNGSCTSSTTPLSGQTATAISDGSCLWTWFGQPNISANDPDAMSCSASNTANPLGGGTIIWSPPTYPSVYRVEGATTSVTSTSYWNFNSFNNRAGNTIGQGYRVTSDITDSQFAIVLGNGSPAPALYIDGRLQNVRLQPTVSGGPNFIVCTSSAYKKRQVTVQEVVGSITFGGFATQNRGVVAAPAKVKPLMVVLEDSYDAGSGYGPFTAYGRMDTRFGDRIGVQVWHMAQGGTGLQNPGAPNANCAAFGPSYCYTFLQRVQDPVNQAPIQTAQIVSFVISPNDASYGGVSEKAAVSTLLQAISTVNPKALIVAFGPVPVSGSTTFASLQDIDSAGSAAFAAWNGSNPVCYIPVANDNPPWATGTFSSSVAPSTANSVSLIITPGDGIHPTDWGHDYISQRRAQAYIDKCLK